MPSKPPEEVKEYREATADDLRQILKSIEGFANAMDSEAESTSRQDQLILYANEAWSLVADLVNPEP